MSERIPQNIAETLKEIGENSALFYLYSNLTRNSDWGVYKNFNESGTDVVLIKERNNSTTGQVDKIKIEVKTRQRLETTSKRNNSAQFTLTKNEWEKSDFVIGFWVEHNFVFVIPIDKFKPSKNNNKTVYKFTATLRKSDKLEEGKIRFAEELTGDSKEFIHNWNCIRERMRIDCVKANKAKGIS